MWKNFCSYDWFELKKNWNKVYSKKKILKLVQIIFNTFIQALIGKAIELNLRIYYLIIEIKSLIQKKEGIPINQQIIILWIQLYSTQNLFFIIENK